MDWLSWAHPWQVHAWNTSIVGYLASSLVLATFCMKSMRLLRLMAIASNVGFITYAVTAGLAPILLLHVALLPINIVRLTQIERERLRRRPSLAAQTEVPHLTDGTSAGSAAR